MHYFLWGTLSRALSGLGPPRLIFNPSEESFYRSLEALTAYINLFGLHGVIAARVFLRVQHLLVDMSSQRAEEWRDYLRSDLSPGLIDHECKEDPVGICSDKDADLPLVHM